MKGRSKAGGKVGKARRRKAVTPKRGHAPNPIRQRHSPVRPESVVGRLSRELNEALEREIALAKVLASISGSTGDTRPVFEAILDNLLRLFGTRFALILLLRDGMLHAAGIKGPPGFEKMAERYPLPLDKNLHSSKAILAGRALQIVPVIGNPEAPSGTQKLAVEFNFNALLSVPLIHEGKVVGALNTARADPIAFTDKQIALIRSFADQAVIAIENARLLHELRERTTDLTESLEQQTATSEVLKVISRHTFDLQPVFDAIAENAVRLCEAERAFIFRFDGTALRAVSSHNVGPELREFVDRNPITPGRHSISARAALERRTIHVPDVQADPEYAYAVRDRELLRTMLAVPMLKGDELVGVITIYRLEVRPFTDKQVALVETFAAQAVIAIENARLLNELRQRTDDLTESLEQQTATSDVLQVISSSPGELARVFEAILANATRICEAKFGTLTQIVDGIPRLMFQLGVPSQLEEYWRHETPRPSPHNAISRVIETGAAVHITDLQAYEAYLDRDPLAVAGVELGGIRTLLVVPMLKDDQTFGTIGIYRQEVRPFTDKQIELVSNFAAQAAIAIENTRLLNELRQRTDDLSKSLDDLRTAQDRLVQTQKLASLGQLTAGIAHEIKNPLNFVNNFSGISIELIDELAEGLKSVALDDKKRVEFDEIADTLRGNLGKVVQHGKRADAIVKNMLLHSREGLGERRLVDVNALVEESLNLAYHGARAEKQGFEITLERLFDPAAGEVNVFPQEITRVLLNMISNGFYAATERKGLMSDVDYEPTLTAATKSLGDRVEIRIRDNGTGIPSEVRDKIFNPFFTTKPTGEGTGLGLSISHDIVVKQHAGLIEVDTQPGEFTEIKIVLPRAAP